MMEAPLGSPAPKKKKKKRNGNRHVYITERTRYLNNDVPSVDTVIEEDKILKRLAKAREEANWKAEAQALMHLGQLMKWKGRMEDGDEYLAQSAAIVRDHTFADDDEESNDEW